MKETHADHALLIDRAERCWLDEARDRLRRTERVARDLRPKPEPEPEAER